MELQLEVQHKFVADLEEYLQKAGFECQREIREALGWPEIIYVVASSLNIIDILYNWIQAKKKNEPETTIIIITDKGTRVDLRKVIPEETKKYLKQ
jgi:hypothetical protein